MIVPVMPGHELQPVDRPLSVLLLTEQCVSPAIIDDHPGTTYQVSVVRIEDRSIVPEILKEAANGVYNIGIVKVQDALDVGNKKLVRTVPHGISVQASATSENSGIAGNAPARVVVSEPQ